MSEVNTQILKDTDDALIVKWVNVNSGSQESNAEKVNCAALEAAVFDLNTNASSAIHMSGSGFVPGETVVGNTTGVSACVVAWNFGSNVLSVTRVTANGSNVAFANGELITALQTNSHFVLANQSSPARSLDVESVWFTVSSGGRVDIEWEGVTNTANAAYVTALSLFDTGYFGKNELAAIFPQPASNSTFTANGSISVSTVGLTANGGYSLVVEFRKGNGFSSVPDARVRDK